MHGQSHALQRLIALYDGVFDALRTAQRDAYVAFLRRVPMRLHVELLQPRIFMSATPGESQLMAGAAFADALQTPAIVVSPNNTVAGPQTTLENTSLTFSSANGNPLVVASGWDTTELQATHGTLTLATKSGLSFSSGSGTGNTTMEFSGSVSAMNAALNGLIFAPTTGYTGPAAITFTTINSGLLGLGLLGSSSSSSIAITITAPPPVNIAPVVDVPSPQTTQEGSPIVLNGGNAISVSDADGGTNAEQITLLVTGGTVSLAQASGLTFSVGAAVANQSMTFTGTLANMNAALDGLTFTPSANFYGTGAVAVTINDLGNSGTGGAKSASATATINVTQVNQAPTLSVPGAQTAAESGQLIFSTANGNAIAVGDVDSGGGAEQLTLSTNQGTLAFPSTSGLTFENGTSNGLAQLVVDGTIAALNTALNGLVVTPAAGYSGAATLSVDIDDQGLTGNGGDKNVSASVAINYVSSLVVTTASDVVDGTTTSISALLANPGADGKISLREAIMAANNTPGQHEIDFAIAGSGVQTIAVTSSLPQITNSVIIDGTTEPGYAGMPVIELDGQGAAFGAIGLSVAASNCTFRGLAVYGFSGNGIDVLPVGANNITIQGNYVGVNAAGTAIYNGTGVVLASSSDDLVGGTAPGQRNIISGNFSYGVEIFGAGSANDIVAGNYVGTDATGTAAIANATAGVYIDGASGNIIGLATAGGGNLISGNGGYGIEVAGTAPANNIIQGNYIGTNAAGTGSLTNGNDGIYLNGANGTQIGGTTAAARNVISGNNNAASTADGIWIDAGSGNTVQGNYIGLNAAGTTTIQNYANGVLIQDSPGNLIGGTVAGAGNVISGNGSDGLEITSISASGNLIEGNFIGTNAAGDASVSNGGDGILLFTTTGNTIGGAAAGAGNLISGNTNSANLADGIWIDGGSANVVQGNQIGTNAAGTAALGNYHDGIDIEVSANNIIGGLATGAGNVIAYNAKGVVIIGSGATGNAIRGNSIYANTTLGIDLGDDGVTANTGSLNASAPNNAMNFPVFGSLSLTGTSLAVSGYVGIVGNDTAFAGAIIDIYAADQSSASGQGEIYLGALTANGGGNFNGTLTVTGLATGEQLTATATDSAGNTSEFAADFAIQLVNAAPTIQAPASQNTGENTPVLLSMARGNAIVISDADADGGDEEATISVIGGILTLSQTAGLTFQGATANGTSLLDFTGTLADINAALNGLTFSPAQDFSGTAALNITDNDLGHTGAGPAQSSSESVNLNVAAVSHTPSVTNATTSVDTQSTTGLVITPSTLDGSAQGYYQITNITGGSLFLNDGLSPVVDGQFITFAEGAAGLKFTPTENSNATGTFQVQASSESAGGLVGSPVQATIIVTVVAPATAHTPTVTGASTNENQQSTSGLVIAPSALDASIPIWFQITQIHGGTLFLNDGTTQINPGDFITAQQGEAGLKFTPAPNSTTDGSFIVQASTTADVSGLGASAVSAAILVTPTSNPSPLSPVDTVPGAQNAQQGSSLIFSTAGGNGISIADPGSDGSDEQITLSADHGTLALATTAGITFVSGTGSGEAMLTFSGTLADINAALNGLTFTPVVNFSGPARISLLTQDLSATNNGIALTASNDIAIAVVPPVTPPPIAPPPPVTPPPTITPPMAVEINNPPTLSTPVAPPTTASPIPTLPVVQNTPAPGGDVTSPVVDQAATSSNSSPSTSTASTTGGTARATATPNSGPVGPSVAPILPRQAATRNQQGDVVSLPQLPPQADLALPAASQIALSPIQRLAMELGSPEAESALHIGTLMSPAIRNSFSHDGSAPTSLAANSSLWRDLDRVEEQMTTEHKMHVVAGAASLVSVGVSVIYFMWAVRAGSVLSSLLSSMPAWNLVDPLPILDQIAGSRAGKRAREEQEDDESLESMVQGAPDA